MIDRTVVANLDLEKLGTIDSCTVSNAVERFNVRLRNEGFVAGSVKCRFPNLSPLVGYAATGRIRTSMPPMAHRSYYARMDWWNYVTALPEPRVMVLQDVEPTPGVAAFVGEIHAAISQALKCVGCVTNGAVRDLPAAEAMGFKLFSGSVAVSHSYAHIIEFGEPVEIGGLKIHSGDLIHGDRHGVLTIPFDIAAKVPEEAARVIEEERDLVQFCKSPDFSLRELSERIRKVGSAVDSPWSPR